MTQAWVDLRPADSPNSPPTPTLVWPVRDLDNGQTLVERSDDDSVVVVDSQKLRETK